ncbi:hypothetical protein DIPPA_01214 [Diplonema papillatum]|nr:hypothetical protein DIPPA_25846 [Diplonema papillatum]KAJ9446814.1 hypothetical protein DIPPA_01214 [Diplonema papillatum]
MTDADGSGDERGAQPPATVKVAVELKTHSDKYSTKDLLVDASIFQWNGDRMLFTSPTDGAKSTQQVTRRPLGNRRGGRAGRGAHSAYPNRLKGTNSEPSVGPCKEQAQPWVTGLPYYFLLETDGLQPLIAKGFTAPPKLGWPAHLKVSVHEKLAAARGLAPGCSVTVSPLPESAWRRYVLEHVELTVSDSFVSRSDLWGAMHSLRHTTLYTGKKVLVSGKCAATGGTPAVVKAMLCSHESAEGEPGDKAAAGTSGGAAKGNGAPPTANSTAPGKGAGGGPQEGPGEGKEAWRPVKSGIVVYGTKFTVRSLSGRTLLMLQVSREMFMYATEEEGDTYISRAIDMLIPDLVRKWERAGCSHVVTVVLFARLQNTEDADVDYVRVVWHGHSNRTEWGRVPHMIKCAVNGMIQDMRATTPIHPASHLGAEGVQLSTARHGNTVEAINLALNALSKHHIDRSLVTTGQSICIITAGTGLLHTTRELASLTGQRVLDAGAGCDLICLGRPPLHVSPVFEYPSNTGQAGCVYERPAWMSARFYCKRPSTIGTVECALLSYRAASKQFQHAGQVFTAQCRMTPAWDKPSGGDRAGRRKSFGAATTPPLPPVYAGRTGFHRLRLRGGSAASALTATHGSQSIPLDESHNSAASRPPAAGRQGSRLLPDDWEQRDAAAFKFDPAPIKWTDEASDSVASTVRNPFAADASGADHAGSARGYHSPRGSGFGDVGHARMNSASDTEDLFKSSCELDGANEPRSRFSPQSPSAGPFEKRGMVVSGSYPNHARSSVSYVVNVSPTKQFEDFWRKKQKAERERAGPRALLISPFDVEGANVLDSTHPAMIVTRKAHARDPFEMANAARWSHLFPIAASDATGMQGDPNSHMWKFIIELALLPLTSPYYPVPDLDHAIPGFHIHHSTKNPASTGVVPLPPGAAGLKTFLHECIVQRLHHGYQFIPPIMGSIYRLSIGHQFHEISAALQQYHLQQWVHDEHRVAQEEVNYAGSGDLVASRSRHTPPSPAGYTMRSNMSPGLPPTIPLSCSQTNRGGLQRFSASVSGRSLDALDIGSSKLDESHTVPVGQGGSGARAVHEFRYYSHNPFSLSWDYRVVKLSGETTNAYFNWSALDEILSGTQDEVDLANKKVLIDPLFTARRVRYTIIPSRKAASDSFSERTKRWFDQVCSGTNLYLKNKAKVADVVYERGDLEIDFSADALNNSGADSIELVLEGRECRNPQPPPDNEDENCTYQVDELQPPPVYPTNACPKPEPPVSRSAWLTLGIPQKTHPRCHLSFAITWLACPGYQIADFIDLCRRRMLQTMGQDYNLVQVPCVPLTSEKNVSLVEERGIQVAPHIAVEVSRSKLGPIVRYLIESLEYVPSHRHVTYGCVLVHNTGQALVFVPEPTDSFFGRSRDDRACLYFAKNLLGHPSCRYEDTHRYDEFRQAVDTVCMVHDLVLDITERAAPPTDSDVFDVESLPLTPDLQLAVTDEEGEPPIARVLMA